jgi:hypothetical protein
VLTGRQFEKYSFLERARRRECSATVHGDVSPTGALFDFGGSSPRQRGLCVKSRRNLYHELQNCHVIDLWVLATTHHSTFGTVPHTFGSSGHPNNIRLFGSSGHPNKTEFNLAINLEVRRCPNTIKIRCFEVSKFLKGRFSSRWTSKTSNH